ncbi:MAG: type II toxin-antitoxin system HipA family toxin [Gammaproteobacteria bacterium]|nr:type II toxin-antitoxin system HipA family toxin [Gammaproteobacteria bacterium]MCF6259813.1 type II toxin-antitoxin system HipA family toxin [Gammaproteobacteria bacterium]
MPSNSSYTQAFVWIWLPDKTEPVVAGKLSLDGQSLLFNYGKSYLDRDNAIAIYDVELPLKSGIQSLSTGLSMPNCIRDAAPDAWGRRVLINHLLGLKGADANNTTQLDELTYLLESGSDRIGALDFQHSATEYIPRSPVNAPLEELLAAAVLVEKGIPLSPELDQALHHGSSIGGARPKVLIRDGDKKYIAKFSSGTDLYSVVKIEFIAMRLAALAGLHVASVAMTQAANKDVLLIKRFDRAHVTKGWQRKAMVSGLTLLSLDEMMARYASYEDLAEIIRHRFRNASSTLRELFSRLVFNILCGNTDDHARNHAAFWDGGMLSLTPAYDICPQGRMGNEATQAMLISGDNRMSQLTVCLDAAAHFLLSREEARKIIEHQIEIIETSWELVCDEASLSKTDRALFWKRQFFNPFSLQGFALTH